MFSVCGKFVESLKVEGNIYVTDEGWRADDLRILRESSSVKYHVKDLGHACSDACSGHLPILERCLDCDLMTGQWKELNIQYSPHHTWRFDSAFHREIKQCFDTTSPEKLARVEETAQSSEKVRAVVTRRPTNAVCVY